MSNAFFWLELIIYEVLLTFRESLLVLSQLSTPTSSLFTRQEYCWCHCRMQKLLYRRQNWTKRNWSEDLCTSLMYKKKYWAQHRTLRNTQWNVWHRGAGVLGWDILFPITQIRLKPAQHDTSDASMLELTHQYLMINCIECLREI